MNSYRLAEGPSMHIPLVQTAKLFSCSMGLLKQFMLLSYYRTLSKSNHLPVRYSVTHISLTVMLRPTRHAQELVRHKDVGPDLTTWRKVR